MRKHAKLEKYVLKTLIFPDLMLAGRPAARSNQVSQRTKHCAIGESVGILGRGYGRILLLDSVRLQDNVFDSKGHYMKKTDVTLLGHVTGVCNKH